MRIGRTNNKLTVGLLVLLALQVANQAHAGPSNLGPPSGNVILDLNGTTIPHSYVQEVVTFTAASSVTNLSFAFRDDPDFLYLSNISLVNTTTKNPTNLVVNGDFTATGSVGASGPPNWSYLNTFGATFGGTVISGSAAVSGNTYKDGAVQAYDGITQSVATISGDVYTLTFYLEEGSKDTTFSHLSTNGNVTDTGGNGIDLLVYAGALPTGTPEPGSFLLTGAGVVCMAGYRWRRRRVQPLAS